ncbi:MAG: (2Fe-2S)-binding protein, partial [Thermoleophilia bacterium]
MQAISDAQGVSRYLVNLTVNGDPFTKVVKANTLLVDLLRNELDLTGTKKGCDLGSCGSCTVLMDGKAVNSCLILALEAEGAEITTVEGVAEHGELDKLQRSFLDNAAVQC